MTPDVRLEQVRRHRAMGVSRRAPLAGSASNAAAVLSARPPGGAR